MIHLQETSKIQNTVTYSSIMYCNYFLSRKIKIFTWDVNIKLSKINKMINMGFKIIINGSFVKL